MLSLGRQQEPQTLASSSAAWLGELLIERLPWVAGDMLAEVQVIGHSVTRQRRSAGSPQLDQQTFWPLHGHHHWRSSGPLSRDGPEAEPQARPERAARHWSDPRAELLRIVTLLLRVVTPGDGHRYLGEYPVECALAQTLQRVPYSTSHTTAHLN